MSKYKITYRCQRCGGKFSKLVSNPDTAKLKCQNMDCRHVQKNIGLDLSAGTSPGIVGASNVVKAVDETARIVMEDYGLSNLKDNLREGDSAAPSLPPQQQALADGFFNGKNTRNRMGISSRQAEMIKRRAIAGAYRGSALDVKSVLPDNRVALRPVGKAPV